MHTHFLLQVAASLGKEYLPAHPVLGIIVTILCIVNVSKSNGVSKKNNLQPYTK